jgi:uncharacterized RDD family membrane protein YckC
VPLDSVAEIETPELVRFRYRLAGPVRRGLAYLIDLVIRGAAVFVLAIILQLAFSGVDGAKANASTGLTLVVVFLVEWGYYVLFETIGSGASPGKRALSLRVVKEGGYPVAFLDSVLRNLLRAADFLPVGYALGLLVMAGDSRFRRLGDRVAGTMVVVEERSSLAAPLVLQPPPMPEELAAMPQRVVLSASERESLELFLRRTALSPARRDELAEMVAPVFARRLGVRSRAPVRFLALVHNAVAGSAPQGAGGGPGVAPKNGSK